MTDKKRALICWVLNTVAAILWAASSIVNTILVIEIAAAVLCVLHGFLAGMLCMDWINI